MDTISPRTQHDRTAHYFHVDPPSHVVFRDSDTSSDLANNRPPPLEYDIASKKRSIAITWTIILSFNAFIPLILYFGLRNGTSLSKKTLVIITEITSTFSVFNWPHRLWKLLRRNGERAPRDRTIFTWDSFQWSFLIGILVVTSFCVAASRQASLRILAMGPVVLFGITALECVITCWMCSTGTRTFCRMSSMPARSIFRPAVYSIIEDVTAVDGAGGQEYRIRLNERYESSPPFRQLVHDVSLYLGIGFLVQTGIQVAVLLSTSDEVSYAVSTGVLWGWVGLSAWWGVCYAKRALRVENLWWKQQFLGNSA